MALKRREKDTILSFVKNSKLNNIIEKGQFVYDKSHLYCVRESCSGCKYEKVCTYDTKNELEETLNKSTRNNIRFGKIVNTADWYLPEIKKETDLDFVERVNGRYLPVVPLRELPKDIKSRLVLAESFKNVHKKVNSIKGVHLKNLGECILYNPEVESYYCFKDSCNSCEYKDNCNREIEIKDREMIYVAIDSASQEPEIVTYLSQEPQYVQIFVNHSLTEIDYLLDPINELFSTVYNVDIEKDLKYHTFIDWLAFEDKTILYNFGAVYYACIKLMDVKALETAVNIIDTKYQEFLSLVKSGKIYILDNVKL